MKEDRFETTLLNLFDDCAASASRGFETLRQHEQISQKLDTNPLNLVDIFATERASLMRLVSGAARLADVAVRVRREASLRTANGLRNGAKGEGDSKNRGSIPQENFAAQKDAATAAE